MSNWYTFSPSAAPICTFWDGSGTDFSTVEKRRSPSPIPSQTILMIFKQRNQGESQRFIQNWKQRASRATNPSPPPRPTSPLAQFAVTVTS